MRLTLSPIAGDRMPKSSRGMRIGLVLAWSIAAASCAAPRQSAYGQYLESRAYARPALPRGPATPWATPEEGARASERAVSAPPAAPGPNPLSGYPSYVQPPLPHGCVGQVPVSGPGFNPCP